MTTLFELSVSEDLDVITASKVLEDLEEVLGKHNLSLEKASWDYL